jgi:hypothetical protein
MVKMIAMEKGRKIYPQRIAVAEAGLANFRVNKQMDKFNLRAKIIVLTREIGLASGLQKFPKIEGDSHNRRTRIHKGMVVSTW